jgi:drug/metabolite transporter (DMT)-like permease
MSDPASPLPPGIALALLSAVLFGASTPLAKLLLGATSPLMLAGLLYLGAGAGLLALRIGARYIPWLRPFSGQEAPLRRADLGWLALAILTGGMAGPALLMLGLAHTDAASASLLLNLEGLATMVIAWGVFHENTDRRVLMGAFAILAGACVLSWSGSGITASRGALLIAGACLCWGIDNNATARLSGADPTQITLIKGLVAGTVNLALALATGASFPALSLVCAATLTGFAGYGASLVLFILGLRALGAARAGAYFSLAPFVGACLAIPLLHEAPTLRLALAGGLMGLGLWLHLTERHDHDHTHDAMEHEHRHTHDAHHQHSHAPSDPTDEPHTHPHRHVPLTHRHAHYPDLHHRHTH